MLDSYHDMRNTQSDNEQALYTQFFELKNRHDQMRAKKKELKVMVQHVTSQLGS